MLAFRPRSAVHPLLFVLLSFAAQPGLLAQQQAVEKAEPSSRPVAGASTIKAFEQCAAYWTSEPGWDTELQLKNNLSSRPLTVTPVLRMNSGQEIPLVPVTLSPHASAAISVNQQLRQVAPALLSQSESYGSVVFRFISSSPMNLHAMAVPAIQGVPVTFRLPAHASSRPSDSPLAARSEGFEGIWWQPRLGLEDFLVVSNISDSAVTAALSLFDASGKSWSEPLSLGPHQIERLGTKDLLKTAGLGGSYGGIRLESSAASALDVVHLVYEKNGKFSAALEMFSRDPNSTVRQRTGSDQKQWTMRAPMLALVTPDPALGLSSHTKLSPTVLVRNTTARNISATMTLSWRGDSGKGVVKLPPSHFAPYSTMQFQVWAVQKQLGIPDDAHWAMVSLTTDALPEDLIAVGSSWDCSGFFNIETKFTGGQGSHFAGGEWRNDAVHNQIAAITNVGTEPADALLTLHYAQGTKKYELQETVAPGDQVWVNFAKLASQHAQDRNGNYLPADIPAVTYEVQDLTPAGHSLMVNDLAVNTALGQAVPACPTCCGFSAYYFSPSSVQVFIDGFEDVSVEAVNACTEQASSIDSYMTDWFSSDASIAAVTPEDVQGVSVGTASAFAEGTIEVWGGVCACHWEPIQPTAPVKVAPTLTVQGSPSNSIFVGTDPNLSTPNSIFATASPAGGTFVETSSVSSDTFKPVPTGGPGWIVGTTTQSTTTGDRKLTFTYTVNSVSASKTLNVTARQFAYVTNNSPSNTCTLGYGTTQLYTYTPYTHPDKTAVQAGIGLSNTSVTESFNPSPPPGAKTGAGALDANSQFADTLAYCSSSPLTGSATVTQTLSIEGYQVRQNTLKYGGTGVTYTSLGPTQ